MKTVAQIFFKLYRFFLDAVRKTVKFFCGGLVKTKKYLFNELPALAAWRFRQDYFIPAKAFGIGRSAYNRQKQASFSRKIKISLLCPVTAQTKDKLQETIASVLFQTYSDWELVLVCYGDEKCSCSDSIFEEAAAKDVRIKTVRLDGGVKVASALTAAAKKASGDYLSILFAGDLLHPSALYEMTNAICMKDADFVYVDSAVFKCGNLHKIVSTNFKPDFSPDYFNSFDYIGHFALFSRDVFNKAGGFDKSFESGCSYDLFLRIFENTNKIAHVQKCLFYSRQELKDKLDSNDHKRALKKHFARLGAKASVSDGAISEVCKVDYKIEDKPLVSILIPSSDHCATLKKCLDSIRKLTAYRNYEIIIIENNSVQDETFAFYDSLKKEKNIKVVVWKDGFNYSAINNFGVKSAKGDYLLLLNNDTEVISPKWIEEMLMFAQRKDVGAVGALLYYPNGKVQHAGVILGMRGLADHSHKLFSMESSGYANRLLCVQNVMGATAACLMVSRKLYKRVGGFDEAIKVAFNDVDFCMKIRNAGYLIVLTPYAKLIHCESESRGKDDTPEKKSRAECEAKICRERWRECLDIGDPYYNPNLSLWSDDFSVTGDIFPCEKGVL